ncbi:MAG TPA: glutathione S-transferase family protein [Polyangiales bacterium]|nr:glutathione S-transferase family protein [Polyangiales bacterium]
MLKLHGFSSSNYYNVVKLALLEKGLPFQEVLVYSGVGSAYRPDFLERSPIGKIPCLETEHGYLTETRCILDYLESQGGTELFPQPPFAKAKLRELMQVIELYLELQSRRLLPNYFARKPPSERVANEILGELAKGARALRALARFDSYLLGDHFSAADVTAAIHVPAVRHVVQRVLGKDPVAEVPGLDEYLMRIEERPAVQRVRADAKADFPAFLRHLQSLEGAAAQ